MERTYPRNNLALLALAGVLAFALLVVFAQASPLVIPFDYDVDVSHGPERHGKDTAEKVRKNCTNDPYWFNPVTRYAVRWCEIGAGRIGYQVLRWAQDENRWKEVTTFSEKVRTTVPLLQQIEEYLVNVGYVNLEWLP